VRTRALLVLTALVTAMNTIGAQGTASSAMHRAATDTTYGIMLALERFAESIRHAEPDIRSYRSPELAAALSALKTAAQARTFRSPDAALGPLADFRFDSVEVDRASKGKEAVIVKARAILTSDRGGARRVVLHFRHLSGQWVPVQVDGLLAYLDAQSKRYASKEAQ
jgi:hypothetical protein